MNKILLIIYGKSAVKSLEKYAEEQKKFIYIYSKRPNIFDIKTKQQNNISIYLLVNLDG